MQLCPRDSWARASKYQPSLAQVDAPLDEAALAKLLAPANNEDRALPTQHRHMEAHTGIMRETSEACADEMVEAEPGGTAITSGMCTTKGAFG